MGDQRAGAVFLCGSHKEDKGNCGEREKCKQRNKASILEWQTHKLVMMGATEQLSQFFWLL